MKMLFAIDKAGEDPVEHVKKMVAEKKKMFASTTVRIASAAM